MTDPTDGTTFLRALGIGRKPWRRAFRDAFRSGTAGAVASTLALAVAGRAENGSIYAPTNAISHWLWGDAEAMSNRPSVAHTLVGLATHEAASVFWATFYERWFGTAKDRGEIRPAIGGALGVSALACAVDYGLTPHRFQPGYEMRLSKRSLAAVYVTFGLGLAFGALVNAGARTLRRG